MCKILHKNTFKKLHLNKFLLNSYIINTLLVIKSKKKGSQNFNSILILPQSQKFIFNYVQVTIPFSTYKLNGPYWIENRFSHLRVIWRHCNLWLDNDVDQSRNKKTGQWETILENKGKTIQSGTRGNQEGNGEEAYKYRSYAEKGAN